MDMICMIRKLTCPPLKALWCLLCIQELSIDEGAWSLRTKPNECHIMSRLPFLKTLQPLAKGGYNMFCSFLFHVFFSFSSFIIIIIRGSLPKWLFIWNSLGLSFGFIACILLVLVHSQCLFGCTCPNKSPNKNPNEIHKDAQQKCRSTLKIP